MCVLLLAAEEEISFPPTYRYERGSRDTYVWQKQKATGVRVHSQQYHTYTLFPLSGSGPDCPVVSSSPLCLS